MQKDDSVRFFIEFVANTENDFRTNLEGLKSFKYFIKTAWRKTCEKCKMISNNKHI